MGTVLITGVSRGIGRATALRLANAGWDVVGTVRQDEHGEQLAAEAPTGRLRTVSLDLTDTAAVEALPAQLPLRLDAVVNNAGIVVAGPVETLSSGDLRRQFDVNVTAQVAVTNAVLPRLRSSRGRIVFVSSVSGRVSTPMLGAYTASKFALEAIADAWRLELRPWGIHVALVEPGSIDTDLWRGAPEQQAAVEAAMRPEHRDLYARHLDGLRRTIPRVQQMARPVEGVSATIERALTARRPRARYVVGPDARAQVAVERLMPQRLRDVAIALGTGVPVRSR